MNVCRKRVAILVMGGVLAVLWTGASFAQTYHFTCGDAAGVVGTPQTVTVYATYSDTEPPEFGGVADLKLIFTYDHTVFPTIANFQILNSVADFNATEMTFPADGKLRIKLGDNTGAQTIPTDTTEEAICSFDVTIDGGAAPDDYNFAWDLTDDQTEIFVEQGTELAGADNFTDGTFTVLKLFNAMPDDIAGDDALTEDADWTTIDVLANDTNIDEAGNPVERPTKVDGLSGNNDANDPGGDLSWHTDWGDEEEDGNIAAFNTTNGQVRMVDQVVQYKPNANFNGTDYFWYNAEAGTEPDEYEDYGLVTITVTAANDAPTDITLSDNTVAENAPDAVIGTLDATDVDEDHEGDTHTFTLKTDPSGNLEIDGTTLQLQDGESLDREAYTNGEFTITVTVTDSGGGRASFDKDFTITVTNVNEDPYANGENATDDRKLVISGQVTEIDLNEFFEDPDVGDTLTFTLKSLLDQTENDEQLTSDAGGTAAVVDAEIADGKIYFDAGSVTEAGVGAPVDYSFTVDLTDGALTLAGQTVYLQLIDDQPAEKLYETVSETTVSEGTQVTITAEFADNDGTDPHEPDDTGIASIGWAITGLLETTTGTVTGDATANAGESATSTLTFTPTIDDVEHDDGALVATVTATVSDGVSEQDFTWEITVEDQNSPPTISGLKVEPNDGASFSKPAEITTIEASFTASDADAEDFVDGLATEDDTITVDWKLERKDEETAYTHQVVLDKDTDATATKTVAVVPGDLDNGLRATLTEFRKDDKITVTVTANDGVEDSALDEKRQTLGTPPWFPSIEFVQIQGAEDYRVVVSDAVGTVVTMYIVDNDTVDGTVAVKPINYLQSRNWTDDTVVKGLRPGAYDVEVTPSIGGTYDTENDMFTVDLDDVEYNSEDAAVAAREPAGEKELLDDEGNDLGLDQYGDGTRALVPGAYYSQETGVYMFFAAISDAAGYIHVLEDAVGAVIDTETVIFRTDDDGAVPTGADIARMVQITQAGDYKVRILAVTPEFPDGADGENSQHLWQITVTEDEIDAIEDTAEEKPPVVTSWGMSPGGAYQTIADIPADGEYSTVDASGLATVFFDWNAVLWASSYRIYLEDEFGEQVKGVTFSTVDAPAHALTREVPAGKYSWYVIARNANGFSEWSPPAAFWIRANEIDEEAKDVVRENTPEVDAVNTLDLAILDDAYDVTVNCDISGTDLTDVKMYVYDLTARAISFNGSAHIVPDVGDDVEVVVNDLSLTAGSEYSVQLRPINGEYGEYAGNWSDPIMAVAPAAGANGELKTPIVADDFDAMEITVTADPALADKDRVAYEVFLFDETGKIVASNVDTKEVSDGKTDVVIELTDEYALADGNILVFRTRVWSAGVLSEWVGKGLQVVVVDGAYEYEEL